MNANADDGRAEADLTTRRRGSLSTIELLLYLFLIAFCFNSFRPVAIPIRPYMFVTFLFLLYFISKRIKILKLSAQDKPFLWFLAVAALGAFFAISSTAVLEYLIIFLIVFISSLCVRTACSQLPSARVIDMVCRVGLAMILITLVYYIIGVLVLRFNFHGNGTIVNGVLLDRNVPRLISFASDDPNITAFMYSPFIFFFLLDPHKKRKHVGLFLGVLLIFLTFSRGALIAYAAGFMFYLLYSDRKRFFYTLKKVFIAILAIGFVLLIVSITNSNIINTTIGRFESSADDNGSGRIRLWESAIRHFNSNPIIGIGLNNTLEFRDSYSHYVHNTYLEVLAETGVLGFSFYVLFLLCMCKMAFRIDDSMRNGVFLSLMVCLLSQMLFLSLETDMTVFLASGILGSFYSKIFNNTMKEGTCLAS